MQNKKKILITGASGFIGSTVVDKALQLGYDVWAGIRKNSSREYLKDERIKFIDLKYSNKEQLKAQMQDFVQTNGRFDYIVHSAGLTKAVDKADFYTVNFEQVKNLVEVLVEVDAVPQLFVFMSTLGVMGIGDEISYTPLPPEATPNPNTEYGKSKLLAENWIKNVAKFPYLILRPTGVYGPRDKDYLILMRTVKSGIDVGAGFKKQLLSFIYVEDLVDIIFSAIDKGVSRREYYVADGDVYTDTEFNSIVKDALGVRWVLRLNVPLWAVRVAAYVSEGISKIIGKPMVLNTDKYMIMKQRNWACDVSPLKNELGFAAKYSLREGVLKTVEWYKMRGWL